ncbi:MAG: Holliday junction branch migration protein RuvA [Pseudomonadales bacterium]
MIGRILGKLVDKQAPNLLVDVNGLAYEVAVPMTTYYDLPEIGETVMLFTHLVVREDAQLLYGFAAQRDRGLFRLLIKVNGVGPKVALAILSGMTADEFVHCVQSGDSAALVSLPGIGLKIAQRLLVETKDRVQTVWNNTEVTQMSVSQPPVSGPRAVLEAESALIALGYKKPEASRVLRKLQTDDNCSSEELIRQALRSMVKQ